MGHSKSEQSGCCDPLPPLPLLTKEGNEKFQKLPTRFGEEPSFKRLLKKSASGVLGPFVVLTYYEYAPRAKPTPPKWLRRAGAPAALPVEGRIVVVQ